LGLVNPVGAAKQTEKVMSQLSSTELRTLVAAQIASGLVGHVAPSSPQTTIDEVAQLAVRIAKALQDAAIKSMHQ